MRDLILLATALASFTCSLRAQLAQPPAGVTEGVLKELTNACPANPDLANLDASPVWSGWGGAGNARFQSKAAAGLTATDVPKLKLKWAFGLPGGTSMYSQPSVAFGRVFVGNDNGVVYSLDAKTGCLYWAYQADMFGRFAPIAAPISGYPGTRYAIFFVTRSTTAYALDAHDGKLLWKTQVRTGLNNLSATAAYHDGRLYVPMSGTETLVGANLDYECCKSRGAVAALDANTGKVLWVTQSIPEPLRQLGENANGKQRWGPAGASVWNTPTVDAKRGLIYVGTGNSFGRIAAATSDSILALRMDRRQDDVASPGVRGRCIHGPLPGDQPRRLQLRGEAGAGLRLRRFVGHSANRQRQGHPVGRGERRRGDRAGSGQGRQAPVADPIVGRLRRRRPPV